MSETKEPKVKTPKFYQVVDGIVPFCPNYGTKFVKPVAANYDYVYPTCNQPFNVVREPETETKPEE